MPYFVLYTALLLLGCFFVGAWLACVMRRISGFGARPALQTAGAGALAGAAGVGAIAARSNSDDASADVSPASSESLFGDRSTAEQAVLDAAASKDDPKVDAQPVSETQDQPEADAEPEPELEAVEATTQTDDAPAMEEEEAGSEQTVDEVSTYTEVIEDTAQSAPESVVEDHAPVDANSDESAADADQEPAETHDVASAVAAASAAAAAAVAAAKASAAVQDDEPDAVSAVAATSEATVYEDILPSPDEDGFVFAETAESASAVVDPADDAGSGEEVPSEEEFVEEVAVSDGSDAPEADDARDVLDDNEESDAVEMASETDATDEDDVSSDSDASSDGDTALGSALAAAAAGLAARAVTMDDDTDGDTGDGIGDTAEQDRTSDDDGTAVVGAGLADDDLMRIKGIDSETQTVLKAGGISGYGQVASLTSADVHDLDETLGGGMRVSRESWIEQATILATGKDTYFSRRQYRKQVAGDATSASSEATPPAAASVIATSVAAGGGITGAAITGAAAVDTDIVTDVAEVEQIDIASAAEATVESASEDVGRSDNDQRTASSRDEETDFREDRAEREAREPREGRGPREDREPRKNWEPRENREPREALDDTEGQSDVTLTSIGSRLRGGKEPRKIPGVGRPEQRRAVGGGRMLQSTEADDLKRIRGVGVVIEKKLNAMGIHSYEQIAEWTDADIDKVNGILDFSGRIERENWIEQAKMLVGNA